MTKPIIGKSFLLLRTIVPEGTGNCHLGENSGVVSGSGVYGLEGEWEAISGGMTNISVAQYSLLSSPHDVDICDLWAAGYQPTPLNVFTGGRIH